MFARLPDVTGLIEIGSVVADGVVSPAHKREYKEPNGNLTAECAEGRGE